MLNIIIIPAFIFAGLAIYAAAEEAVEWKTGRRRSLTSLQDHLNWMAYHDERRMEIERKIIQEIDAAYENPIYRLRLWLANIIAP